MAVPVSGWTIATRAPLTKLAWPDASARSSSSGLSFSFSFEEALSPEIYRFFVVPTGNKAQLVVSYPVDIPLGRASRRFNRSSSALVRLRDLTTYLARHESVLSGVPPIINEIWRQRELIGPKMFIRPSRTGMYTDWLTADVLGSGAE